MTKHAKRRGILRKGLVGGLVLLFATMVVVGVHAHAWPLMFKRPPNPPMSGGVGSYSRVADVVVHLSGALSSKQARPGLNGFSWGMGSGAWTWSPPESEMYVIYRGSRGRVKRDWVVSWPSYRPKSAVVGVFQTRPGAATMFAVHGAWLWGVGLVGIIGLSFAPAKRALRRRRGRRKPWACARCGYDLRGTAQDMPCPECGAARTDSGVE